MNNRTSILALAVAGFLAACGGGGDGARMPPGNGPEAPGAPADGGESEDASSFDAASAISLTGSLPPTEDVAGQRARSAATVLSSAAFRSPVADHRG